jgi:glycosyltransferase involved in cell wall biosynthesis
MNRLFGGEQWLLGLEKHIIVCFHVLEHESKKEGVTLHTAETYTPYTHQAVELRKSGIIKKLVCTCWETISHANEKFARVRKWKSEAYKYVDVFHTPTQLAKNALTTEGVDPKKIVVIPYGVDLSVFHPCLSGDSRKGKKCVVLTVARTVPEKGLDIHREVIRQLSDIAEFRWVDSASYSDMPAIYNSSDIFFLPSQTTPTWEEQYGMSLIEAMACGLPIVTTDSGAIPEVVGDAGIVLAQQDVDKLVKTLRELIQNPGKRATMSLLSLARARALYDAKKISKRLAKLY